MTLLVTASRLLLAAAGVASVGAAAYRASICCSPFVSSGAATAAIGFAVGAALLAVAWRAHAAFVGRFAAEVALVLLVLVSAEVAVTAAKPETWTDPTLLLQQQRERAAREFGLPFDGRAPSAVARELRAQGIDALPGTTREWPMSARGGSLAAGFYPLSHAGDAVIVECNEDGQYRLHATDEFGFNNPPGLISSGQADIAVVGASLAWGHCVGAGESMVDRIRERYPRTTNFGFAGSRVLTQLASFREYVEPLEPRFVVWVINPRYALPVDEARSATLQRYLEPEFSQDLMRRQPEADEAIRQLALASMADPSESSEREGLLANAQGFRNVYKLPYLRRSLSIFGDPEPDLGTFEQVLGLADAAARRWGGTLLIVVSPSFQAVTGDVPEDVLRSKVLDVVRRLELEVVDGDALFRASDDPGGLFPLRMNNHPNAEGHALLANAIVDALARMDRSSVQLELGQR